MQDYAVRRYVYNAFRIKGLGNEQKLIVSDILTDSSSHGFLRLIGETLPVSVDSVVALVRSIRDLELYMPVRAHRVSWRAEPVQIAVQLEKTDPIVAYLGSQSWILSDRIVPAHPTIALVPREFTVAELAPGTTTAAAQRCADEDSLDSCAVSQSDPLYSQDSNSDGIPDNAVTGLYLVYSSLYDAKEPWIRGDPEVEVHITGPAETDAANDLRTVSCAGAEQPVPYRFDQNANTWLGYVLLLAGAEFDNFGYAEGTRENRGLIVQLYEDDDTTCQIREDPNRLRDQLAGLALWGTVGFYVRKACIERTIGGTECALAAWGVLLNGGAVLWNLGTNNDDFLGLAVKKEDVPGFSDPSASHVLLLDSNSSAQNGGINIVYHRAAEGAPSPPITAPSASIVGPASVRPGSECLWTASVQSEGSPITYYWMKGNTYVGNSTALIASLTQPATLYLQVSDPYGQTATVFKDVAVSESAPICEQVPY